MNIINLSLLVLHLVGLAALFGGWFTQIKDIVRGGGRMLPGMLHGAALMLITGLAMFGVNMGAGAQLPHLKYGIKLLVLAVIFVLLLMYRNKPEQKAPAWAMWSVGGLSFLNIVLAVFWH